MATSSLTYSDLRYWYLSELNRLRKSQHAGNAIRTTKEAKEIRQRMAELRLAQRGRDSVRVPSMCVVLRPWG